MFLRFLQVSNEHTLIELLSFFELDDFIAFDLETTGLDNINDRITEISACRFIKGKFVEEFTSLVNPEIPIPKNIISSYEPVTPINIIR